jgi:hypothetical protein
MDKSFPWQPSTSTTRAETACVNFASDLHLYAAGFKQSAETLLEHIRSTGHDQDFLVYPIVYNLRHAVELLLKQVIRAGHYLIDQPGDFPDGHRLNNLWATCKPVLKRIWPNDPAYATVETTIKKLCELDPEGEAFRYPVTSKKSGRLPTVDTDLRYLDLGALVEDAIVVIDLLDGADTGIDVYLDAKHDMLEKHRQVEAEIRAEYEADMRVEYEAEMRDSW